MDSFPSNAPMLIDRALVQHDQGWDHAATAQSRAWPADADRDAVTLLLRDGSRLRVALAEPVTQAAALAAALAPPGMRPDTITLDLNDGSRLMLASADILGLHLPPARPAAPARPALIAGPAAIASGDVRVFPLGQKRVMQILNFLPADTVAALYRYVLARQPDFQPSKVISNDPEYRKSMVLFKFPEYETMFSNMLRAALPQITDALELARFDVGSFECQLTATSDRGYFKPHNDNAAALAHRKVTYVYYFHRQPKPFTGGEIRFFDHNPFAVDTSSARRVLDLQPLHNSIVFFDSSSFHEVRDTICAAPVFENSRFTINGWLGTPKPQ